MYESVSCNKDNRDFALQKVHPIQSQLSIPRIQSPKRSPCFGPQIKARVPEIEPKCKPCQSNDYDGSNEIRNPTSVIKSPSRGRVPSSISSIRNGLFSRPELTARTVPNLTALPDPNWQLHNSYISHLISKESPVNKRPSTCRLSATANKY